MKISLFAERNIKEVLRDPLNLFFGLGFPLVLLVVLSAVNKSIPPEAGNTMFVIENVAPGLTMFGTAFMALFAGMLLSKDRTSSFLMRLFASPMKSVDFILGYTLPMLVAAAAQAAITLLASTLFGLGFSWNMLPAIFTTMLSSLLFVGLGLLFGSFLSENAAAGICGALLTNLAGWLSGIFIPLTLIGGMFQKSAELLPFYHSVQATKATLSGNFSEILPHLAVVLGYTVVIYVLAVIIFRRKMSGDNAG